jgi:hypothetical protein
MSPAFMREGVLFMRRIITVVVVALVMGAMMLAMAMPAFAQGGSENSCGASNPNIGVPAGPPPEKGDEFEDCGFRNNPHGGPPGHEE